MKKMAAVSDMKYATKRELAQASGGGFRPEVDEETETLNLICTGGATATVDAESGTLELTF